MRAMTDLHIRPYQESDRPAVIALARELQAKEAEAYDRLVPPDDIGDWYLDYLHKCCRESKGQILVAEDVGETGNQAVVGYAVLLTEVTSEDEVDEIDHSYAYIQDIAVTASCRGRGIGTAMMTRAEAIAREAGAKWLRLSVLVDNLSALRIYERAGFRHLLATMEKPLGT